MPPTAESSPDTATLPAPTAVRMILPFRRSMAFAKTIPSVLMTLRTKASMLLAANRTTPPSARMEPELRTSASTGLPSASTGVRRTPTRKVTSWSP